MKKLRFLIVSALAACLVFAGVLLFGPVSPESQAEPLEQQADYIEVLSDILEDTEFIDNARQAAVDFDLVPGVEYVADEVIVVFSKTVTVSEAATLLGAFDGVSAEAITQESLLSPNTVVLKIAEGMSVADAIAELQNLPEIAFSQPNFIYRHLFDLDELEALLPENEALPMDDESLLAADELVTPEEDVQANGEVLEFDASELEALKDLDALAVTINDPQRNNQWALASSRAYDAWGLAQTNRRVTVAVIDSGVRTTHEDLVNNIVPGSYRDVTGRGVTGDVTGHGTHVAGIIAAQANNGLGVAGISYNARIIPINVFYAASGEYTSNTSMVVAAYDYLFTGTLARDTNLKVINMSLGGVGSDSLVESRINGAYNLGVLTVCAAGNNNSNDLVYPGAYSNCINVANLQRGTGVLNDVRNPTSNWGNTIDISAPGTLILSTTYGSNSSYGYMTGTSMASPFVAGIAALLFAAEPRATPAQVRSALFNTAKDLGAPGKDIYYGWGQVNPYDALIFMKDLYSMSVTASVSSNQMNASIRVTGAVLPMASSVLVPVWRSANQSDLIWYPAQRQSDGSWIATVNIANHRLAGTYNAHVYATISGIQSLVASTTFNITTFTPTIAIQNNAGTTFDVVVSSLTPSGLSAVRLGVWSTSNQSNLAWYTATRQTNGSYRATVNIANHGFATGVYQVHAYATAGNGVPGNMAAATATTNLPPPTISATVSSNQMNAQIKVSGGLLPTASSVLVPVWRSANQSDLIWYPAQRQSDGSWIATVNVANHRLAGIYNAHAYATIAGVQRYITATTFNITTFTPTVAIQNNVGTTFDVVVSSLTPSGLSAVRLGVWSTSNQSNLAWYTATRQTNGSYRATVNIANHGFATGVYQVHAYATAGNGVPGNMGATTATTNLPPLAITATVSSNQMNAQIKVSGGLLPTASSVVVPVWRSANQSDLIWYPAQRQSDGSWIATVNVANHRLAGIYNAHVYATIAGGQRYLTATTFNITTFTPTIAIQNNVGTTFDVVVSSLTPSGLSAVRLGVWSTSNQSNLAWYTATRQTNGSYRATVNIANHGFATGVYQVHAYATAGNGVPGNMGATTATTNLPPLAITATVSSNQMNAQIKVSGGLLPTASSVVVPVWRSANQSDLIWYPAQRQSDGSWIATVNVANHRLAGIYNAHVYATIAGGQRYLTATTFNITTFTPTIAIQNNVGRTFDVVVSSLTPSGLSAVRVAVWSTPNQSNLVWYTATRQTNGSYRASVNIANHGNIAGTYNIHVYATAGNGVPGNLATTTSALRLNSLILDPINEVKEVDKVIEPIDEVQEPIGVDLPESPSLDSVEVKIIGQSNTTVDQMVSFFNASNGSYPSTVYNSLGAATIEEFCELIFEEAELEGVKAEVLFAQIMKETNWLRFTEAIQPEQCNYGGLGVTEEKPEGESFADVKAGLRVQVQLLKCFASNEALENACESVLWEEITQRFGRGSAPNLADLSEKWANSDSDYGKDLMAIVKELLAYQQ